MVITTAPLQPVGAVVHIHVQRHRALLGHRGSWAARGQQGSQGPSERRWQTGWREQKKISNLKLICPPIPPQVFSGWQKSPRMRLIQVTEDKNPEVFLMSGVRATESPPQAAKRHFSCSKDREPRTQQLINKQLVP